MDQEAGKAIIDFLSDNDSLRKDRFEGSENPLEGHCYVATEAMYHYLGGMDSDFTPCQMEHEGTSHWFLRGPNNEIIDLTRSQFDTEPDYSEGRGRGFQKTPSKRCVKVLNYLEEKGFKVET